ncbi:MAG: TlyA family RNA methyltransferase [Candidatus Aminicenantales bacterium]
MRKERVDQLLAIKGLAESSQKAQVLIMAGRVYAGGKRVVKSSQLVSVDQELSLLNPAPYVGRGGQKLEGALAVFRIPVNGKIAADIGSSTGGFTDCLLQKGAQKVYAVDVDTRQLNYRLRKDSRVVLLEKNARYLKRQDFLEELDLITMDVSFISVLKILPALKEVLGKSVLLCLLKPQFEAGKGLVNRKGIVRDPFLHEDILKRVVEEAFRLGFRLRGMAESPIRGQKGNREFFAHWSLGSGEWNKDKIQNMIKEAVWNEKSQ